jgi:hypothetical protein
MMEAVDQMEIEKLDSGVKLALLQFTLGGISQGPGRSIIISSYHLSTSPYWTNLSTYKP